MSERKSMTTVEAAEVAYSAALQLCLIPLVA